MKCCICGAVKNVGQYLDKIFENMEKIGSLFDDYVIILYYDNSHDNTLQKLKEYQQKNSRLKFFVNLVQTSNFRTHRLATARNWCLQMIKTSYTDYEMFIMMDCDDVCQQDVKLPILQKYLGRNDWDSLSFNKAPYYDIWALSIRPYIFSYNHFNGTDYGKVQRYITNKLNRVPPVKLLRCASAFNGFAIYRTNKFLDCEYDGRIRLDLIPPKLLLENIRVNKSPVVFKDYGHVNGVYEDCEHRPFHLSAIQKNNARICISSEVLF